jgi:hypothetical protein
MTTNKKVLPKLEPVADVITIAQLKEMVAVLQDYTMLPDESAIVALPPMIDTNWTMDAETGHITEIGVGDEATMNDIHERITGEKR